MEEMEEVWKTLDTCSHRLEKYIAEALNPLSSSGDASHLNMQISGSFICCWAAMIGARGVQRLPMLINEQTLPSIMDCIPPGDWKQGARERPLWIQENTEEVLWKFID
jgi:hypothetical protein